MKQYAILKCVVIKTQKLFTYILHGHSNVKLIGILEALIARLFNLFQMKETVHLIIASELA